VRASTSKAGRLALRVFRSRWPVPTLDAYRAFAQDSDTTSHHPRSRIRIQLLGSATYRRRQADGFADSRGFNRMPTSPGEDIKAHRRAWIDLPQKSIRP